MVVYDDIADEKTNTKERLIFSMYPARLEYISLPDEMRPVKFPQ